MFQKKMESEDHLISSHKKAANRNRENILIDVGLRLSFVNPDFCMLNLISHSRRWSVPMFSFARLSRLSGLNKIDALKVKEMLIESLNITSHIWCSGDFFRES